MTWYDVYIGYNDDSFSWENGNWNGNTPKNGSPRFPTPTPFNKLIDKIQDGTYQGKQLDWGAWGAKVSKAQIVDFIIDNYHDSWHRLCLNSSNNISDLKKVYDFVQKLDEDETYVLVAIET